VELSAFPTRAVLRWDLAVRLLLALAIPLGAGVALGDLGEVTVGATMAAALASFGNLGSDLSSRPWLLVTTIGVPLAMALGVATSRLPTGGVLVVFLLFTAFGAFARAGFVAQLAWFPVATAGMLAALLIGPDASLVAVTAGGAAGAALALVLSFLVPLLLRPPTLTLPPEALEVDTDRLRRMVRRPSWRDWAFPLVLGAASAALLVVFDALTGGFKPYWSVLAFVSVLAPTAAETRRSAWETIGSTAVGVVLAGVVLALDLSPSTTILTIAGLGIAGALLLLRQGFVSKALITPLPVVLAAAALGTEAAIALPVRLGEYVVGAALGVLVVVLTDVADRRLRPDDAQDVAVVG
jgi:hypothetical protein